MNDLVFADEYGLKGVNFYWEKYEAKGLSRDDILSAGLTSNRVEVSKRIIPALQQINKAVGERGYELFIKEGYRSKRLYEIMYQRRVEKFGKEETDRLINMKDMPHASGLSVDIALFDKNSGKEVYMRNGEDGTDALFVNYYKDKDGEAAKKYQELQDYLIGLMCAHGFELGTKNEYFHFNYVVK